MSEHNSNAHEKVEKNVGLMAVLIAVAVLPVASTALAGSTPPQRPIDQALPNPEGCGSTVWGLSSTR